MKRKKVDTHEERNVPVETKGHSQLLSNYLHSEDTVIKKVELRHMDWGMWGSSCQGNLETVIVSNKTHLVP